MNEYGEGGTSREKSPLSIPLPLQELLLRKQTDSPEKTGVSVCFFITAPFQGSGYERIFVGFSIHFCVYMNCNLFVFRDLISTLAFFAVKSKEIAFLMKNKEIFAKLLTKRKMSFILLSVNRRERVVAEQMRFQRAAGGGIAAGQNREWAFEGEPNSMTVGFDGVPPV